MVFPFVKMTKAEPVKEFGSGQVYGCLVVVSEAQLHRVSAFRIC